jgi:hypothetical protein
MKDRWQCGNVSVFRLLSSSFLGNQTKLGSLITGYSEPFCLISNVWILRLPIEKINHVSGEKLEKSPMEVLCLSEKKIKVTNPAF